MVLPCISRSVTSEISAVGESIVMKLLAGLGWI
ncbi:MAG: hypothetical protein ACJA1Z_001561, partial [Patiriisocius sp.]